MLVGTPTVFLRTTGCNLRCSYCDTTYAYTKGTELSIPKIIENMKKFPCSYVCITGGEPLLQKDLLKLVSILLQKNYTICLETNGSLPIQHFTRKKRVMISLDIKCPSSGMHERMILQNISALSNHDQLKFIMKNKKDYEYAKTIVQTYKPKCTVFFQPVWGSSQKRLATWILHDRLHVRLGFQLHKVLWGARRGV